MLGFESQLVEKELSVPIARNAARDDVEIVSGPHALARHFFTRACREKKPYLEPLSERADPGLLDERISARVVRTSLEIMPATFGQNLQREDPFDRRIGHVELGRRARHVGVKEKKKQHRCKRFHSGPVSLLDL